MHIKSWCLEYGQRKLSLFRTSRIDVRNRASFHCPYSGHQLLMFRIRRGILSLFRTSLSMDIIDHVPKIIVHIRDITVLIPDISFMRKLMAGIWTVKTGHIIHISPEYGQWKLALFRTSIINVQNMDSFLCPYTGHQDVDVRDMDSRKQWCPEHGHWCTEYEEWCPEYG